MLLLVLAVLLVAGGLAYGIYSYSKNAATASSSAFKDMDKRPVVPDDTQIADPAYVQAADPTPDVGVRFKIPSVNLDVPLGEATVVNNVIDPPGFSSVFKLRNLGVSLDKAATGPVYVAAHSLRSPGRAPGNYVINEADGTNGTVAVKDGAEIDVGDLVYSVVSSRTIDKNDLSSQSDLWANTPGMLVFITCLQSTTADGYLSNGHAKDNAIIVGQLVS